MTEQTTRVEVPAAAGAPDWTTNLRTGRRNSSPQFLELVRAVGELLRNEAPSLGAGDVGGAAQLIVAQLAHIHHLAPPAARLADMRLVRDLDDFATSVDEEGDIRLHCPSDVCDGKRLYLFGPPKLGMLIGDAYVHIAEAHQA